MKTRLLRTASLLLMLSLSASAAVEVSFESGEAFYPQEGTPIYTYDYTYPVIAGEGALSEELNHYFEVAIGEMTGLVLPMFAADMPGDGSNRVTDVYEITCNSDDYFSFLLRRSTLSEGKEKLSLQSAVFAASGPYAAQSLTLRGLAGEIGESSAQLAELVLEDVWRGIEARMARGDSGIREDMSFELLSQEFFPESYFYAGPMGEIVFYLQPGLLDGESGEATFTYTAQQLEALLKPR